MHDKDMMRKVKYIAISDLSEMTLAFAVTPSAACLLNASLASDHDMLVQIIQKVVKLLLSFLKDELDVVAARRMQPKCSSSLSMKLPIMFD